MIEKDRVRGSIIVDRRAVRPSVRRVAAVGTGHTGAVTGPHGSSGPTGCAGRIHPLPGLLAIAIAAVVSGSSRVVEIIEWAADLPDAVWDRLGATRDAFTGARRVPDDSTLSRVLTGVNADALDAAVCRWLLSRAGLTGAGWWVIAVDGKTLRGSGPAGAQVHLLAALDQAEQIVLAQSTSTARRTRSAGSRRCWKV